MEIKYTDGEEKPKRRRLKKRGDMEPKLYDERQQRLRVDIRELESCEECKEASLPYALENSPSCDQCLDLLIWELEE